MSSPEESHRGTRAQGAALCVLGILMTLLGILVIAFESIAWGDGIDDYGTAPWYVIAVTGAFMLLGVGLVMAGANLADRPFRTDRRGSSDSSDSSEPG